METENDSGINCPKNSETPSNFASRALVLSEPIILAKYTHILVSGVSNDPHLFLIQPFMLSQKRQRLDQDFALSILVFGDCSGQETTERIQTF